MSAFVKYKIIEELEPIDPTYGKYLILGEYDDIDKAVHAGKASAKYKKNISVVAYIYINENNYKNNMPFDLHIVWHEYLDDKAIKEAEDWAKERVFELNMAEKLEIDNKGTDPNTLIDNFKKSEYYNLI